MNSREKFLSAFNFEKNMGTPKVEIGYWAGTLRNWCKEGLTEIEKIPESWLPAESVKGSFSLFPEMKENVDKNVIPYFGLDTYPVKLPYDISPQIKTTVVEETNDYKIILDSFGRKRKELKNSATIPEILEYPIKTLEDLNNYMSHYDFSDFSKRIPPCFFERVDYINNRDFPLRLGGGAFGFFNITRWLIGDMNFMYLLYDSPGLVKKFYDFFTKFVMEYWGFILDNVTVDCINFSEDFSYNTSMFISPHFIKEFILPNYVKLLNFLKQFNVRNFFVNTNGILDEIIPLLLEAGITGIMPLDNINDVVKVRQRYPNLVLFGGFNKKALFKDSNKANIDKELEKVKFLIKFDGYIPHIDHDVSMDVTWDNFKYYRTRLNSICDSKS
jgi:hypothetical protein